MMMKIHTTQNLNSQMGKYSTNIFEIPNDEIRLNYSEHLRSRNVANSDEVFISEPSFKGKKPPVDKAKGKKIIKRVKQAVGTISKEPNPEKKKGDKLIDSRFFNALLKKVEGSGAVALAMFAVGACALRALTIALLPTKKNKEDNMYAVGQSLATGLMGFLTASLLFPPFNNGAAYAKEHFYKDMKEEALKKLNRHLDINTIWKDKANNVRAEMKEWKDIHGRKFIQATKEGCDMVAEFKRLTDSSEKTFEHILGVNVDWASQKGKSFNDVLTKDGKKMYDVMDMSNIGIIVEQEGAEEAKVLLRDLDRGFLEDLVKDSKDNNNWGSLDVKSVYDENGKVKHFRDWKNTEGKEWKLDLDDVFVSSPYETNSYTPRRSGAVRSNGKLYAYQENGVNGELGTAITDQMLEDAAANEVHEQLLKWIPDLVFKMPTGIMTIALVPIMLKAIGLKKSSATQQDTATQKVVEQKAAVEQVQDSAKETSFDTSVETKDELNNENQPSFKGKMGSDIPDEPQASNGSNISFKAKKKPDGWLTRLMAKLYAKPLMKSDKMAKFSRWFSQRPGNVSQHVTTAGSIIMSSTYIYRTLTNDKLDKDRRRTLAINQGLCCIVPAILAYTVDGLISDWFKKTIQYNYTGHRTSAKKIAELENNEAAKKAAEEALGRIGAVSQLKSLILFAFIYRYITPVLMTPIANKIGDNINAKKHAKQVALAEQKV